MPVDSWNVTQTSVVNSMGIDGMPITIGIMVAVLGATLIAFYSVEYLARAIEMLSKVFGSVKYVLYGLFTSGLFYGMYIVIDAIRVAGSGFINPVVIGYGIAGYITFYIVGRLAEYAILRAKRTWDTYHKSNAIEIAVEQIMAGQP